MITDRSQPSVAIGMSKRTDQHLVTTGDFIITNNNTLLLTQKNDVTEIIINMGISSKRRINFLIECLERIKLHASDD